MSDDAPRPKCEEGSPAWVMTFADLMSLLMCFFVLLLSFSEMDLLKFKQIAGSMKSAFGVQREIRVRDIPKGTSVVKKEFSPGRPEPTALNTVRQHTTDDLRRMLKVDDDDATAERGKVKDKDKDKDKDEDEDEDKDNDKDSARKSRQELLIELAAQAKEDAEHLKHAFQDQLNEGLIEIETVEERIIIRIQEKGSFPSGSADLKPLFQPVISEIGKVLANTRGHIIVAGHTDDIPIATRRFRSNWELSAARAVTVVHHLKKVTGLSEDRFLVEGHADADPLVPNDSPESRAKNRRVEVVVVKGRADMEAAKLDPITVTTDKPTGENPAGETSAGATTPAQGPGHEKTKGGDPGSAQGRSDSPVSGASAPGKKAARTNPSTSARPTVG